MAAVEPAERRPKGVWHDPVKPRVLVGGEGPPLLYLHGAGGLVWGDFQDFLARDHTVYAPDHPGTSMDNPEGIDAVDDLRDLVMYYEELLEQLDVEPSVIVGHSFGGWIAAEFAATVRPVLDGLVLIAPLGLWHPERPVASYLTAAPEDLRGLTYFDPEGPVAMAAQSLPEDETARQDEIIRARWALACTGKFTWPIPERGLRKRLHRIRTRTLLIWGSQDRIVPMGYADDFAEALESAEVAIVDRAGHVPQLERPVETQRVISEFLTAPA